jgi:uncharacterized membrane protein
MKMIYFGDIWVFLVLLGGGIASFYYSSSYYRFKNKYIKWVLKIIGIVMVITALVYLAIGGIE